MRKIVYSTILGDVFKGISVPLIPSVRLCLRFGSTLLEFRHYEPILKDSNFLRTYVIHFSAKQPGQK